ncbi:MAG: BrnT family toxin [Gemmatimonadota bacterium]|nr:BrnT family toxin [Gemmatimonadota bacterium]
MASLRFTWDATKARANITKHGISFEEAETVFSDEDAVLVPDPEHSAGEERFILIGLSVSLRVLVVVHCERAPSGAIRLISARRATRSERGQYAARWK